MVKKSRGTKEYFAEVFTLESRIHRLYDKIEVLRSRQAYLGGGFGPGVQKSRDYTRTEGLSLDILELEDEVTKAKNSLLQLEREIKGVSGSLQDPMHRAIITWRYICRLKWKDISARAEMSEMQVMREHNAAIMQMEFADNIAG